MSYVCAIESFPFHHISFLPDHLLGSNETDGCLQYFDAQCRGKPLVINLTQSITGSKDDIDKSFRTADFSQSVRKRIVGLIAGGLADVNDRGDRGRSNHQIKVFRVSLQTSIMAKRVTGTDEKFDPIAGQPAHYVLIEGQHGICTLRFFKSASGKVSALISRK
jgi:hypothetical protein